MTPEPAPLPPPLEASELGPPPMSEGARLAGVFFSPGKAFADIARRPRWWVPIILAAILTTIYLNAFTSRVGWEQTIRTALQQGSQGQSMPKQQMEQIVRTGANVLKYLGYVSPILGLVNLLVVSTVLLLLFDVMMSAEIGFKRLMGVVAYAYLPMVIYTALSMVVLFLKSPEDYDLQNPLMFNLGAFLSSDVPGWLKRLGSSIDLFSFWVMALLAIGIAAAARKKMSVGKAFTSIAALWMLYVMVVTSFAAMSGR